MGFSLACLLADSNAYVNARLQTALTGDEGYKPQCGGRRRDVLAVPKLRLDGPGEREMRNTHRPTP